MWAAKIAFPLHCSAHSYGRTIRGIDNPHSEGLNNYRVRNGWRNVHKPKDKMREKILNTWASQLPVAYQEHAVGAHAAPRWRVNRNAWFNASTGHKILVFPTQFGIYTCVCFTTCFCCYVSARQISWYANVSCGTSLDTDCNASMRRCSFKTTNSLY